MPDGVRDNSQTGKFSRADFEPRLDPEQNRRKIKPQQKTDDGNASRTGIMPIFREPADDSAVGDDDKPAE